MIPQNIEAIIEKDKPLLDSLGLAYVEAKEDALSIKMTVQEHMINSQGICHGGYLFCMADTASAYLCANSKVTPVTADASITYTAPAKLGDKLVATARIEHHADKASYSHVRITHEDTQEVLCLYRAT
ncbi:MAG: hotdog fold thioesterase, partial [Bdellovibrionales bacterium]|nr:hotdog fold thioesterase [Bdellovibrionales bacterium]